MAYAKTLRFVGLEVAARQVVRGAPAEGLIPIDVERKGDERRDMRDHRRMYRVRMSRDRYGADIVLDAGVWGVSIDTDVLHVLRHGIKEGMENELADILVERSPSRRRHTGEATFATSLGIGCVFYPELE